MPAPGETSIGARPACDPPPPAPVPKPPPAPVPELPPAPDPPPPDGEPTETVPEELTAPAWRYFAVASRICAALSCA
ncbi:hypothetical protein BST41_09770 [Mycolicibacterium porcinum]|nr:hypothetical protein BST41_09770 [Mycolicibacterium porcinum]